MTEAAAARIHEIRSAVLRNRYERAGVAQPAAIIHRTLLADYPDLTREEVDAALLYLTGQGHLSTEAATLGPLLSYTITGQGQRFAETNGVI